MLFAPYKAILAESLAPTWIGSEEQKATLREGLGLTPPGDDVWGPLGEATKFLHPEDRVRLLVDFVKAFSGGDEQRQALLEVKDVLTPVRHTQRGRERDRVVGGLPYVAQDTLQHTPPRARGCLCKQNVTLVYRVLVLCCAVL